MIISIENKYILKFSKIKFCRCGSVLNNILSIDYEITGINSKPAKWNDVFFHLVHNII